MTHPPDAPQDPGVHDDPSSPGPGDPAGPTRPGHADLLRLSVPLILSNLSVPLLGLTDTWVAGHLPDAASLAAVGVGSAVFSVVFLGFNFLRMGTTGLVAQAQGRGDTDGTRTVLAQAGGLALGLAAAILLLGTPLREVSVALMAPPGDVVPAASAYIDTRLWAAPFTLLNLALAGWFLGLGRVAVPTAMLVLTNVANIALDVGLVMGLGWGVTGLAWATVGGEATGTAVALTALALHLPRDGGSFVGSRILDPTALRALVALNADLFVRTVCLTGSMAFFTAQAGRFGEAALAANALLLQLQALMSYGLDGFAHAAEVLVGQALGRRALPEVRRAIRLAFGWSLGAAALISLAYATAGPALVRTLTDLPAVRQVAIGLLPWMVLSPLVSTAPFVLDGVFVAGTWSRDMRNTMLVAAATYMISSWALAPWLGHHGLWAAFLLFLGARGVGLGLLLPRRLASVEEGPPPDPPHRTPKADPAR